MHKCHRGVSAPLAVDLFAGLGGWTDGLLAEGYRVVGFDLEQHVYGEHRYPAQLVIQDVRTLHGRQFKDAALIVASPPCQFFSYCAMPWSRAKQLAADVRADPERTRQETALFDACFRIQREASEAAAHHIPMVVENVRGAIPWVGRSRWHFGAFHLWGDVPALMPMPIRRHAKRPGQRLEPGSPRFNRDGVDGQKVPSLRFDGSGGSFQTASVNGVTVSSESGRRTDVGNGARFTSRDCGLEGVKQAGISGPRTNGKGNAWFEAGAARHGSKSPARKAASAMIAKIPLILSRHIAAAWRP